MIVGLGNPGEDYENTPHNIGFAVVQELAIRHGVTLQRGPKPKMKSVKIAEEHPFILLCPMSYMNLSGQPVSAALKWYSLKPKDLLVVCDDANLPLGRIRIRTEGGAGGQKGLASIIQTLGTQTFARVRVGVGGGEPGADLASYVLSKFRGDRRNQASKIICKAADAVECWLTEGMDAAMNKHNQQETEQ
jgi:PTH1 family peptidyl-tRNA hydrolase